jgi:hypothetical protein
MIKVWPVCLGVRHPSGTCDQFFFFFEIFFRQLLVYYFVAPSLMRGRVCNLLLLLVLASAVLLGSDTRGTQDHILLSQFLRLPQPGGPGPRIYIPPETGWPRYTPGHWVPFLSPLTTHRATVEVFYLASTREGNPCSSSSSSYIATDGQSVSSSWCRGPFGACDQMLHFSEWQLLFYFFM